MSVVHQVARLSELCYAAGQLQNDWQEVVAAISNVVDGAGAALVFQGEPRDNPTVLHAGYTPSAVTGCLANHAMDGPWREAARKARVGAPFALSAELQAGQQRSLRNYDSWIGKHGLGAAFGIKIRESADHSVLLAMDCPTERGARIADEILALLAELSPHLQRSLGFGEAIHTAGARSGLTFLENMQMSAALIDRRGHLVELNAFAREQLLASGAWVANPGNPVRLPSPRETESFHMLLNRARAAAAGPPGNTRFLMAFTVPNAHSPNMLECIPVRARQTTQMASRVHGMLANEPWVLVRCRLRDQLKMPTEAAVRTLGLTEKEAIAAIGLIEGLTAEEQAAARGVSAETVRWHTKNVYEELNCDRAELARLIFGLIE